MAAILAACGLNPDPTNCNDPTFEVTTTTDMYLGTCNADNCSLRDAVEAANTCTEHSEYTIVLPAGTYELTMAGSRGASQGDLNVSGQVHIIGNVTSGAGADLVDINPRETIIDGDGLAYRIFHVESGGLLHLENLSVWGGDVSSREGNAANGGGILNEGQLIMEDALLGFNTAGGLGGGLANFGDANLSTTDTYLNTIEYGTLSIDNTSAARCGGGIYNAGTLNMLDSWISLNEAFNGRGLCNDGGIAELTNVEIATNGSDIPDDGNGGGIFHSGGSLQLDGVRLAFNEAVRGGGIFASASFEAVNMTITDNHANFVRSGPVGGQGGGIYTTAEFELNAPVIEGNSAEQEGGGLWVGAESEEPAIIENSAIVRNEAPNGAGLFVTGNSQLEVVNTTFSGNNGEGDGLAVFMGGSSLTKLLHATVVEHYPDSTAPGAHGYALYTETSTAAEINIQNSLIMSNSDSCENFPPAYTTRGGNYSGDFSCQISGSDDLVLPGGAPLAADEVYLPLRLDNGTYVHPLVEDSPVVNFIPVTEGCPENNQRDAPRPLGFRCDIGAYESEATASAPITSEPEEDEEDDELVVLTDRDYNCREGNSASLFEIADTLLANVKYRPTGIGPDGLWLQFTGPVTGVDCWVPSSAFTFFWGGEETTIDEIPDEVLATVAYPAAPEPTADPDEGSDAEDEDNDGDNDQGGGNQGSGGQGGNGGQQASSPPAAPANAYVANQTCNSSEYSVELAWFDQADNEDGFRIYRDGSLLATLNANANSYTDQPPYGGPYTYTIEAYNSAGADSTTAQEAGCLP